MRDQRGFSFPELLVAVAVFVTASGIALALLGSAATSMRADGQANRLVGVFQTARESAITRQRDIEVSFDPAAGTVSLVRQDEGVAVPMQLMAFEYRVGFRRFDGMGDTPDGYGAGADVDFGAAARLFFISDGTLVDEAGVPVNGTVFLGIPSRPETARAITLTGATARARLYRWTGAAAGGRWVNR